MTLLHNDFIAFNNNGFYLSVVNFPQEFGVRQLGLTTAVRRALKQVEQPDHQNGDYDPKCEITTKQLLRPLLAPEASPWRV